MRENQTLVLSVPISVSELDVKLTQGLKPDGVDVIFAPTDSYGTHGKLGSWILDHFSLDVKKYWPNQKELSDGYFWVQPKQAPPIVFIVTVSTEPTMENLASNLRAAFLKYADRLKGKNLWIPLMGTGVGKLSQEESLRTTIQAIKQARLVHKFATGGVYISVDPTLTERAFRDLAALGKAIASDSGSKESVNWSHDAHEALAIANGIRIHLGQAKIHMEHLVFGLYNANPAKFLQHLDYMDLTREKLQNAILDAGGVQIPEGWQAKTPGQSVKYSKHSEQAIQAAIRGALTRKEPVVNFQDFMEGILSVHSCNIIKAIRSLLPEDKMPHTPMVRERAWATSDDPSGEADDLLKIQSEVDALCEVVTAKDVYPPISIGLFGDWGTGKTFFMKKMLKRVREIAEEAGKHLEDTAFHSNICQIEFNAWHYIDTNLWASLTSEIFEQLSKQLREEEDKDDPVMTRARLLKAVLQSENALADAERMREEADQEVKEGLEILDRLEENDRKIETELKPDRLLRSVIESLSESEEWKEQRRMIAQALRFSEIEAANTEFQADLLEVRGHLSWLKGIWIALKSRKTERNWTIGVLCAAILVTVAIYMPLGISMEGVVKIVKTVVASITGAIGLVSPFLKRASAVINKVREFYEKESKNLEIAKTQRKKELEDRREELRKAQEEEQSRVARAQAVLEKLRRELNTLRADQMLVNFVSERRASADYSQHLGVIARARKDFQYLSDLLERQRNERTNLGKGQPFVPRVDRIILYIDDLDRCPENKVVDVLQAVHLLLAFPLFVVVVGVDPRWLLHSLRQHSEAFQSNGDQADISEEERMHWRSTPLNYLEKIFQIPFALRPMGPVGFAALVDDLSEPKRPKSAKVIENQPQEVSVIRPEGVFPKNKDEKSSLPHPAEEVSIPPIVAPEKQETGGEELVRPVVTNPKYLTITDHERKVMKLLHEFVPTARATKRFLNIYRMIRNAIPVQEKMAFIGNEGWGNHRITLLLLALLIGYPEETTQVLRKLLGEEEKLRKDQRQTWWDFIENIIAESIRSSNTKKGGDASVSGEALLEMGGAAMVRWHQIQRKLSDMAVRRLIPKTISAADFINPGRQVARYSFQSSRVLVAGRRRELEATDED